MACVNLYIGHEKVFQGVSGRYTGWQELGTKRRLAELELARKGQAPGE